MTPNEDPLSSFGIKMAIDSLTSEIRLQRTLTDMEKPDAFMKAAEESHGLIRENFKEWRDYLYKYILVMTTITGFFTTLLSAKWTRVIPDPVTVYWAFGLMGGSIFVGLIAIFATIFIERQIIDSHVLFALPTSKDRDPDMNPIDAHKMGSREAIAQNQVKLDTASFTYKHNMADESQKILNHVHGQTTPCLETETDEKQRAILKMRIKADKRHLRLMKYVAAPVSWYEYVRVGTTTAMMILSLAGIGILMYELLVHSVTTPSQQIIQAPQE